MTTLRFRLPLVPLLHGYGSFRAVGRVSFSALGVWSFSPIALITIAPCCGVALEKLRLSSSIFAFIARSYIIPQPQYQKVTEKPVW